MVAPTKPRRAACTRDAGDPGRAAFSVWGHELARFTSPFALLLLLAASLVAWLRHLRGQRTVMWQPTRR